ncbi:hypothetical protein [Halorubrum lacusprofundi]|jgi:threonine/homoserine/homoserine lactone efflux protein|uniref:hypothetical protein n=1 Tax=Halorubrum lacusprofundi TaxID=2247 RepID=UPI000223C0AE|nr:hypothetical protein [Halorubrum lacusprofundi]AEN07706.1 hypothetical protein Halar_0457 [halophilic archaeon DL31]MCG1007961.1 hypothetical protein [Halorubrum lacusprofundi]
MVPLAISRNALISLLLPILALVAGYLVYRDSIQKGRENGVAGLFGFIIAGLFLAGSVPGLVALALAQDQAAQGFPTSIRIVPGCVALLVYLYFR